MAERDPAIEDPQFTGLASYVLFIPSGWGKTKACEYFMHEKKAKGVMLRGKGRLGLAYEDSARYQFGGLCHLLSRRDFRKCFVKAMKDEAGCLPIATYAESVIIFFDEVDQDTQVDF